MQLLIYTLENSPRASYIFSALLTAAGISKFEITTNTDQFKNFSGAKINYSAGQFSANEIWMHPVPLLFETNISPQTIDCFTWNNTKAFYKTEGDFAFDIFAASFYLITRYEEYLPHTPDEYGRYAHTNSIAFKEDFLQLPLVNIWLQNFMKLLQQKYSTLIFKPAAFSFIPTYDIDIAWSYRNKGFIRNIGGAFKSMVNGQWSMINERVEVLTGKRPDPFDVYDWLDKLHEKNNLQARYFFLLAKKNRSYDRNISSFNKNFQKLICDISEKYITGIHPSWQSGDDVFLFDEEINTLEKIIHKKISASRQHYIRMKMSDTYRQLIKAGIKEDFSMGYGSINGFRASYCMPFAWYDLEQDKVTDLTIYPFCFMEANSYYEQHYTLQQVTEELKDYYNTVKDVNGMLITIFHNHILGNEHLFAGWKEMYGEFCLNLDLGGL